jgi:hypothetical protein
MNTEPQVADPAVADPMVIEPSVVEPAPTETLDPVVETPIDPITGGNGNPGSSSNTSNGNQVAVNSNFDYSVHNFTFYSYSSTTNQETLNAQMGQANSDPQLSDGFNCGTGAARLGRSYRFESRQFFRGNRRLSRVDRITNFEAEAGDTLELSRRLFKGIGELDFVAVANRKASQRAARTDNDIIYEQSTGRLYFNANSGDSGFGSKGGLFAILESTPLINDSHFVIF